MLIYKANDESDYATELDFENFVNSIVANQLLDQKTIQEKKSNLLIGANIDCVHIRVLQRLHSMNSLSFIEEAKKTTVHCEKNDDEIGVDESITDFEDNLSPICTQKVYALALQLQ